MARGTIKIIKDDKRRQVQLVKDLKGLNGLLLKVGFLEGDMHTKRRNSKGKIVSDNPMPVAELAAVHEFGTRDGKIPERSFIRSWVDANNSAIKNRMQKIAIQVIDMKYPAEQGMKQLGVFVKGGIQRRMRGPFKALSPKTIKRKGSSVPLIDTGQMRANVRFAVEKRGLLSRLIGRVK